MSVNKTVVYQFVCESCGKFEQTYSTDKKPSLVKSLPDGWFLRYYKPTRKIQFFCSKCVQLNDKQTSSSNGLIGAANVNVTGTTMKPFNPIK